MNLSPHRPVSGCRFRLVFALTLLIPISVCGRAGWNLIR